jgi:hypothetical protein
MTMFARQFIRHNFWLKIFALILALLTWSTVRFAISRQIAIGSAPITSVTRVFPKAPVRLLTGSNMTGRFRLVPNEVTVTLSGDATILEKLSGNEITPFVNISKGFARSGGAGKVEIFAPAGMSIVKIEPPEVKMERLEVEPGASK